MNAAEREAPQKKIDIPYLQVRSEQKYLERVEVTQWSFLKRKSTFLFLFSPLSHSLSLSLTLFLSLSSLSLSLALSCVSAQLFYIKTSLNVDCWACVNIGRKLFPLTAYYLLIHPILCSDV